MASFIPFERGSPGANTTQLGCIQEYFRKVEQRNVQGRSKNWLKMYEKTKYLAKDMKTVETGDVKRLLLKYAVTVKINLFDCVIST